MQTGSLQVLWMESGTALVTDWCCCSLDSSGTFGSGSCMGCGYGEWYQNCFTVLSPLPSLIGGFIWALRTWKPEQVSED